MNRWNQAPLIRDQVVLFSPTLDAAISEDHSVRLVDEVLRQMDWSAWESRRAGIFWPGSLPSIRGL